MLEKVASFSASGTSDPEDERAPSGLWLSLLLIGLFVAQLALYHRAFSIKPASDDFTIVHEIVRGNEQGVDIFFRQSLTDVHHRPFKSVAVWAVGQLPDAYWPAGFRIVHFLAMACYLVVAGLWCFVLRLSAPGVLVCAGLMLFHPVLPQPLASVDGMDGLFASALVWLGAWFVLVLGERVWVALLLSSLCFVLASGWKEYSFGVVPLATWTMWIFHRNHRWRNSLLLFAGLCLVGVLILWMRQQVMPPGRTELKGAAYVDLSVMQLFENAVLITTGLLFFGNSIWVYFNRGNPAVLAMMGVAILLAVVILALGIAGRWQSARTRDERPVAPRLSPRTWIVFLLVGVVAASFPVNLIFHMSEMYLAPMILPLALLAGVAAEGYRQFSRSIRLTAVGLALVALVSSVITVWIKVEGIRDVGERAQRQVDQIFNALPPDPHDLRVGLLFDLNELPANRTYAVYRMGDEILLVHPMVLNYFRPGKNLTLGSYPVGHPDYRPEDYDVILKWNYAGQRFEKIKP